MVEDETGTRKVLRKILNDYRLIVTKAVNGQIALDEVKKQSLGVIFLNLMMLIMDGLKFLEELRIIPEG